jgi:excisionase family DNA binding protein
LKGQKLQQTDPIQPIGLTRGDILLPEEVADILRSSRKKVLSHARAGKLPCLRFGREVRFLRSDIVEHVLKLRSGTSQDKER